MRYRNWQSRFQAMLAVKRNDPFVWGENDCALFAADCVMAVTGEDLATEFRGRYDDARGATDLLNMHGGLSAIVDTKLHVADVKSAQVADVGLALLGGRPTLTVCGGDFWMGPGETGIVPVPAFTVVRAWRVL